MATLDPTLRKTLEQRLGELESAQTLQASPTSTIKPGARNAAAWTRPDPERLPVISLGPPPIAPHEGGVDSMSDLEVRTLLGQGGMGRVHSAFQHSLAREVAIKTLFEGATPDAREALLREAVLTGALEHPGIVPVHALGVDKGGAPVLVMKRIEGAQWGALIHDANHPAWERRPADRLVAHLEILMQVCQTVHFAHDRGVLHRDIKPENIMLGDFGEAYLVDWGIAVRLTSDDSRPTGLAGTPAYMAPEMILGDPIDERADVYLLGATLHEALTGELRNVGETLQAVLLSALTGGPHAYGASIPAELAAIMNRATARNPGDRFSSVLELRGAITEYLQHRGSRQLTEQARERCDRLSEALTGLAADEAPKDLQTTYQLANETRFAFTEALREWPDNLDAHDGLEQCLSLIVELELRQGHVETAEAMLRDIAKPSEKLVDRLARARVERDRKEAERARLRALEHDLDSNVASKLRAIALAAFAVSSCAASAFALAAGAAQYLRPEPLVGIALAFLIGSVALALVLRKSLLQNAFNRRAMALFVVASAGLTLSRAAAMVEHLSLAQLFAQDSLVLAGVMAAAAVTLLRWLWIMVFLQIFALILCVAMPESASLVFGITLALVPAGVALALRQHRREQQKVALP